MTEIMTIASFDIGKKNFSFCVEEVEKNCLIEINNDVKELDKNLKPKHNKDGTNKSSHQLLNNAFELIKTEMSDIFDLAQQTSFNHHNPSNKTKTTSQNSNKFTVETIDNGIAFNFTSGIFSSAYKTTNLLRAYLELDERAKILAFCFRYIARVCIY
jgi:hypothetical protein